MLISLIILGALRLQTAFRPYKHAGVNTLAVYLYTVFLFILIAAGMLYSQTDSVGATLRLGLDISIYVAIATVICMCVAHLIYDVLRWLLAQRKLRADRVPDVIKPISLTLEIVEALAAVLRTVPPAELVESIESLDDDDLQNEVKDGLTLAFVKGIETSTFMASSEGERFFALERKLGMGTHELAQSIYGLRRRRRMSTVDDIAQPLSVVRRSMSRRASLFKSFSTESEQTEPRSPPPAAHSGAVHSRVGANISHDIGVNNGGSASTGSSDARPAVPVRLSPARDDARTETDNRVWPARNDDLPGE